MKDFRQLKVWEKAHLLVLAVYSSTAQFPREETYGLASQIRRAATSIPSNIAEGCGREGEAELARFCIIARGSATELDSFSLEISNCFSPTTSNNCPNRLSRSSAC